MVKLSYYLILWSICRLDTGIKMNTHYWPCDLLTSDPVVHWQIVWTELCGSLLVIFYSFGGVTGKAISSLCQYCHNDPIDLATSIYKLK